MWVVHRGPWWKPEILEIFETKEAAEKARILIAHEHAAEKCISGFLAEIGETLDSYGVTRVTLSNPPSDEDVLDVLLAATVEAVEDEFDEGAIGNLCSLVEAMGELYDPDTLLRKIAEGLNRAVNDPRLRRFANSSDALENLEIFLNELEKVLGLSKIRVKRALLAELL